MKTSGYSHGLILLLSALIVSFSSCEKVIDLKLKPADTRYVIEGVVSDQEGGSYVSITQTKEFDADKGYEPVGGAAIIISDDEGNTTTLAQGDDGLYRHPAFKGISGKTYHLKVQLDGKSYTASSTMPAPVPIDSMYISKEDFFDEEYLMVHVTFVDPAGMNNYYSFDQYINGLKVKEVFYDNDELRDGANYDYVIFNLSETDRFRLKPGDSVRIDMHSTDAAVYKYWYSLYQGATGTGNSASPANPVSNMQGGALGYFSAQTSEIRTLYVPL